MNKSIVVISGGLGVPSTSSMLGEQLGKAAQASLQSQGFDATVTVIELKNYAGDIANNMVSRYASPRLAEVIDLVGAADAIVAVSPVFTASVSGLFKSFLDIMDPKALESTPVLVAATGGSARHSMVVDYVLRPIFSYLRANIMPTGVFAAPEDWGGDTGSGELGARAERAGAELALAVAGRVASKPEDTSMESLPFEQLLANIHPGR
jgi:FMN reductase